MPESSTTQFRFYKRPFLLLSICLCIGILIGYELADYFICFFALGIAIILAMLLFFYQSWFGKKLVILFTSVSFLICGAILIQVRLGAGSITQLSQVYHEGDVILIRLHDVGNSDKEWTKLTGDIQKVYKSKNEIVVNESVVLFIQEGGFPCKTGDYLLVSSKLNEIENQQNPGEFDAKNYWNKKGFKYITFVGEGQYEIVLNSEPFWIAKQLNALRDYLKNTLEENLKGQELAIALALILGDKSLLDAETTTSFTNTGAMHVLAVSGLHIGIIMQILMAILGNFSKIISRKNSILLVVVLMWIYAIITGLSPSVLRAVFMFSVLAIAQVKGKNHDSINSLFFTAFVLMLFDPFTLYDIGFQLSFLAMLGIFLLYKPIEQLVFINNKWLRKIWQGTAIGFAAQLMTTPLSLYYFHQFPNYFVLTNIGLMASSGLILGLGLFLFSFSWLTPIARLTGVILSFIVYISLSFIEWVEGLPGAVAYGYEIPIVYVFLLTVFVLNLFLFAKSFLNKVLSLSIGFGMLVLIVFQRYNNCTTNELCVFNSRQPIITVRKGDELFCFYNADQDDFKKVKFSVEGYLKLHPAKVHYCSLEKKNWNIQSKYTSITTLKGKGSLKIQVDGNEYLIVQSDYFNGDINGSTLIGMPWVELPVDHSLKEGPFIHPI